jgi:hypothetical protein
MPGRGVLFITHFDLFFAFGSLAPGPPGVFRDEFDAAIPRPAPDRSSPPSRLSAAFRLAMAFAARRHRQSSHQAKCPTRRDASKVPAWPWHESASQLRSIPWLGKQKAGARQFSPFRSPVHKRHMPAKAKSGRLSSSANQFVTLGGYPSIRRMMLQERGIAIPP